MNKHTPGPWRFDLARFNSGHEDAGLSAYGSVVSEEGDWFICGIEDAKEWEANARLIAAAPELYEALCDMVSDHDDLSEATLEFARAALAKARGSHE